MSSFEWKQFYIKCILPEDQPSVFSHLRNNFYLDEPVNKWFGMDKERISDHDRRMVDMMTRHKYSLMAVPKSNPDKVAGVLIIHFHEVDNPLPEFTPSSPITSRFREFLHQLEQSFNVHEAYGISSFPELAILSIDQEFRGFGLATELYRVAISQLFSEKGGSVPLIYSEFSNPFSRKVGERLGFQEVGRYYLNQFGTNDAVTDQLNTTDENGRELYVSLTILKTKKRENEKSGRIFFN